MNELKFSVWNARTYRSGRVVNETLYYHQNIENELFTVAPLRGKCMGCRRGASKKSRSCGQRKGHGSPLLNPFLEDVFSQEMYLRQGMDGMLQDKKANLALVVKVGFLLGV